MSAGEAYGKFEAGCLRDVVVVRVPWGVGVGDIATVRMVEGVLVIEEVTEPVVLEAGSMTIGDKEGRHMVIDGEGQRLYDGKERVW
jgi:hypothetical protein